MFFPVFTFEVLTRKYFTQIMVLCLFLVFLIFFVHRKKVIKTFQKEKRLNIGAQKIFSSKLWIRKYFSGDQIHYQAYLLKTPVHNFTQIFTFSLFCEKFSDQIYILALNFKLSLIFSSF